MSNIKYKKNIPEQADLLLAARAKLVAGIHTKLERVEEEGE